MDGPYHDYNPLCGCGYCAIHREYEFGASPVDNANALDRIREWRRAFDARMNKVVNGYLNDVMGSLFDFTTEPFTAEMYFPAPDQTDDFNAQLRLLRPRAGDVLVLYTNDPDAMARLMACRFSVSVPVVRLSPNDKLEHLSEERLRDLGLRRVR